MKVSDRIEQTVVGLLGLCALVIGLWQVVTSWRSSPSSSWCCRFWHRPKAARHLFCPIRDYLHPQYGDWLGAPVGRPQSLSARNHYRGAGGRGHPRHSAIPDSAASIVLGIITYVPFLTLWLSNLVFG
jgi:hypothetical protein